MDYEKEVGFFLTEIWRFGPLYTFLSIAAQCLMLDTPFRIEYESGESPLNFDGNALSGEPEYISALEKCVKTLEDDFIVLIEVIRLRDKEYRESISEAHSDEL